MHLGQKFDLMKLAARASQEAGQRLLDRPKSYLHINALDAGDIKLQADVDSEILIRKILAESKLPVIGEEQGGDASLLSQDTFYWVIDPLDGTYNYVRDIPLCCVSIGLMKGKEPILGVIYDFNRNILYQGMDEGHLTINHKPCDHEWIKDQATGLLLSSLRYDNRQQKMVPGRFEHIHDDFKKVRFLGTAALSLAWVAAGHAEGYKEFSVHLWDVAAGLALMKASKGFFKMNFHSTYPFALDCFASSNSEWLARF